MKKAVLRPEKTDEGAIGEWAESSEGRIVRFDGEPAIFSIEGNRLVGEMSGGVTAFERLEAAASPDTQDSVPYR